MKTILILVLFPFSVFANEPKSNPCKADIEKFCKDSKSRTKHCLKEHLKELSAECKAKVERKVSKNHMNSSDQSEDKNDCEGVKFKDPNFKSCMKEKIAKIKEKAKAYRDEKLKERIKMKEKEAKTEKNPPSSPSMSPTKE